jgi:hypothetical protein
MAWGVGRRTRGGREAHAGRACSMNGFFDLLILIVSPTPLLRSVTFTTWPNEPCARSWKEGYRRQKKENYNGASAHGGGARAKSRSARAAAAGRARASSTKISHRDRELISARKT